MIAAVFYPVEARSVRKRGRPFKIVDEHRAVLVGIVGANPTATLEEIQAELARRTGVKAHAQTIQKVLRRRWYNITNTKTIAMPSAR